MAQKIRFTKMHGCGNDYIYVNTMEQSVPNPQQAAIVWSDRHKGIGSDGLVLIGKSPVPEADYTMHIYNADGSEAMMCGNASRCIGKHINYPPMAAENGVQGRVVVQFVVDKTGKIGEVKVVRTVDKDLDKEAVRVCKSLPKFTPGRQNGQPVAVWYTLPVSFKLQGTN